MLLLTGEYKMKLGKLDTAIRKNYVVNYVD